MLEEGVFFGSPPKKARPREGAGKSGNSWVKHNLFDQIVSAQVYSYRHKHRAQRILLIDGNAGDGEGVCTGQNDLFEGMQHSRPTAQILMQLAARVGNTDVVLCDHDNKKRLALMRRFPEAIVVEAHEDIPKHVRGHEYAVWLSDPCGYAGHGVEAMARLVARLPISDFVVALNEGALNRVLHTQSRHWRLARERWAKLEDPQYWLSMLSKKEMHRSARRIAGSQNFRYRILLISNYTSHAAKRLLPDIIQRSGT
jgi:hypothetical protein